MDKPATVDAYMAAVPERLRPVLDDLRAMILSAVPGAEERISWGMPSYKLGRPLLSFAAFKEHCSLFGMSGGVYDELGEALEGWRTSRGTLRFTPERPPARGAGATDHHLPPRRNSADERREEGEKSAQTYLNTSQRGWFRSRFIMRGPQ
ncbi:MAG: iron chaperone [Sphingomonadales bacterium]